MSKLMNVAMATTLIFTLVACGKEKSSGTAENKEKIVIKYANWNNGPENEKNLERMMISAYEKKHKNVDIQVEVLDGDWNQALGTLASAGKLPDVFMQNNIPTGLANNWLLDVSKYANKDDEFSKITDTVKNSSMVEGKVFGIPFAQFFMGYFVNKNILDSLNLDIPKRGYSIDQFLTIAKKATNLENKTVGIDSTQGLVEWYPGAANSKLGWYTYGDGSFHLNSKEMIDGMNKMKELASNGYAYSQLKKEQQEGLSGEDAGIAFESGQIALYYSSTYNIPNFLKKLNFDWDYIGIPGGRAAIVNDFLGISKNTKHPKEAYDFAKFMSFGKEGFKERMNLSVKNGQDLTTLPISTDKELLDKYWEIYSIPGIQDTYNHLNNALVDPMKTLPGYIQARWEAKIGVKIGDKDDPNVWDLFNFASQGVIQYQDYAKQLDELANKSHKEAVDVITKAIK